MAVGDNFLYVSVDDVGAVGLLVMRIPLIALRDGVAPSVDFTIPSDSTTAYGGHLMQNPGRRIFWAGHNSINQMRIFSSAEDSNTYSWDDVDIASWEVVVPPATQAVGDRKSNAPDGTDWNSWGFPYSAEPGAVKTEVSAGRADLWFAFGAPRQTLLGRPHPYVRVVRLDEASLQVIEQRDIWGDVAYQYPALATNLNLEIGISLA